MSTPEQAAQALQNSQQTRSLKDLIESSAKELARALPDHMKPERLVRIALTCIRQTPDLSRCTPESFLGALFTAAQIGVEPIAGRAYLIPFNNSKKKPDGTWHTIKEAQFVLGYRGVVDLFFRHEKAINLQWGIVKANDYFVFEGGTNSKLEHSYPKDNLNRGNTVGFWTMANLVNGGKPFHYMAKQEVEDHAKKHSKTWDKKNERFYPGSPWADDFDAMALKTVLIQLCKILPLSIELQRAIQADETSRDLRPGIDDVLDLPDQTDWDAIETEAKEKTEKALTSEKEVS